MFLKKYVNAKKKKCSWIFFQENRLVHSARAGLPIDFGRGVARAVYLLVSQSVRKSQKDKSELHVVSWVPIPGGVGVDRGV